MTYPRAQLVDEGYDAITDAWEAWKAQITDDPRDEVVTIGEAERPARFQWVLAQR